MNAQKALRLTAFALTTLTVIYIAINLSLAWAYVHTLTHPACIENPERLTDLPPPIEKSLLIGDGSALRAWYYPPKNGRAILALGGPSGSLGKGLPPVEFLIRHGFGILQIDSRACADPPLAVTLGAKEIQEAGVAIDLLLAQPGVNQIGVFGFSMGGVTAIRTAARHPEIGAVAAEGGYFNMGDDFVEPESPSPLPIKILLYTIAGSYWLQNGQNPWEVSPVDDLPRISPRPVLLIYGQQELDGAHALAQYAAAHQPKNLWVVPGGSHGKNHLINPQEYQRRVLDFFDRSLGGTPLVTGE